MTFKRTQTSSEKDAEKATSNYEKQADKKAWLAANRQNTFDAYQAYLNGNTLKRYAMVVKARLQKDEKAWQNACEQDTPEAYQAYLDGNTVKDYAVEAQTLLQSFAEPEDDDYLDGNISGLDAQSQFFPEQQDEQKDQTLKPADEAIKRLQILVEQQREEKAWQKACEQNTITSYQIYLKGQTFKQHAEVAIKRLESLLGQQQDEEAWQKTCEQNTIASYQTYLKGQTLKQNADVAQKRLQTLIKQQEDKEAWQKACEENTVQSYQVYLKGQTLKQHADEAINCLQNLLEQQQADEVIKQQQPLQRYTDNGDGSVTDNQTGLIWLKNVNGFGSQDWETAMECARNLAHGQCGLSDGSKAGDWRLPTKDEWEAMVGTERDGDVFSGVQSSWYWSSTSYKENTSLAWSMYLDTGRLYSYGKKFMYGVWAVRGGLL
ncbi:hypothetical protein PN36_22205 [Candidatus Thiomargarita nelsonii]|uniref:Lcl C-terminal domain-containing protein n=1 Tax=Candidatus Thiomargarita nelsonii TaxID=1003181 RepID=A0A4E0R1H0_9GAMM|nr:hypothetical protein PN36_22205 [Candidatus Thiomargarita nelsonii]